MVDLQNVRLEDSDIKVKSEKATKASAAPIRNRPLRSQLSDLEKWKTDDGSR